MDIEDKQLSSKTQLQISVRNSPFYSSNLTSFDIALVLKQPYIIELLINNVRGLTHANV